MLSVEGAVRGPRKNPENHCPIRGPLAAPDNHIISPDYWVVSYLLPKSKVDSSGREG